MSKRNIAIILVRKEYILECLNMKGGILHKIEEVRDTWEPEYVELTIEHPTLDKVEEGYTLKRIHFDDLP